MKKKVTSFTDAVEALLTREGSHSAAARAIGITPVYYRQIRNGKHVASKPLQELIILKAQNR
jgi:hypothetical protein